jgi:hypothetical protein
MGAAGAFEQRQALGEDPVFRRVPPVRKDRWVFGDRDSSRYLVKFSWTRSSGTAWSRAVHPSTTRPGRLLDPTTPPRPATVGRVPARIAAIAAGTLPRLRRAATRRRPPAATPERGGAVAQGRAHGDSPNGGHHARRPNGRHRTAPDTHPLRAPTSRRRAQTGTAANPPAPRGLLEPDAVKVARPVLRGPGAATHRGYATTPRRITSGCSATRCVRRLRNVIDKSLSMPRLLRW